MNTKEAFREGIKKFASEELDLDEDHTNRYVDLVEKEADQLAALVALSSDGEMDKSAADSMDDPLEKYLCKRAGEMLDEAEGMEKEAVPGGELLKSLASKARTGIPQVLAYIPGAQSISHLAGRATGPVQRGASKLPGDVLPKIVESGIGKPLEAISQHPAAVGAGELGLGGLYYMSGGDQDEMSEEEAAELGDQATSSVGMRGLGSLAGGIGGLAAGNALDLGSGGRTLAALAPAAAGAFSPELLEAMSGSEEA